MSKHTQLNALNCNDSKRAMQSHHNQINQSINPCILITEVRVFDELTSEDIIHLTVKEQDWLFLADFIRV